MNEEQIINLWCQGHTLDFICKEFKKEYKKTTGLYINLYNSLKIVEPIIFNYMVSLLK